MLALVEGYKGFYEGVRSPQGLEPQESAQGSWRHRKVRIRNYVRRVGLPGHGLLHVNLAQKQGGLGKLVLRQTDSACEMQVASPCRITQVLQNDPTGTTRTQHSHNLQPTPV